MGTFATQLTDEENCKRDAFGQMVATHDVTGALLPGVTLDPQTPCFVRRVTTEQTISAFLDQTRFYNTSGFNNSESQIDELPMSDKDILFWTLRPTKELATRTGGIAFREQNGTKHWTYFEEYFRDSFFIGDTGVEEIYGMKSFKRLHEAYIKYFKTSGYLFAPRPAPMQVLRNNAREEVIRRLSVAFEFQAAVRKLEDLHKANPTETLPAFVIERVESRNGENDYIDGFRAMLVKARTSGERAGTPIYLKDSESVKSFYDSSLRSSVVDLDCEFLPRAPDLDVNEAFVGRTCEESFAKWRQQFSGGAK